MSRAAILEKNEVQTLIKHFLDDFQNCVNQSIKPTQADFERSLSSHFYIESNGKNVAKNLSGYLNRVESFQKRYTHCSICFFAEDTVCADHHFACNYKVELTLINGQKNTLHMMAIGACENDKITSWKQVVHETGTSQWEA